MGMFFPDEPNYFPDVRPVGFPRYAQVLERDWKKLICVNFLTLLSLIPFALGMGYAILSSSVLVLVPVCVLGGMPAGPGIAGMYDCILRSLRDDMDDWWFCYKKAMKQNWKAAFLPGVIFCTFWGFYIFACFMLWISGQALSLGTLAVMAVSAVLFLMVFAIWWPQIVLFSQKSSIQIQNCILFCIQYFLPTLGVAALQLGWYGLFVLFLPWTGFLVPVLGVWYLWYVSTFFLYDKLDTAFRIEEQLQEAFPEQYEE